MELCAINPVERVLESFGYQGEGRRHAARSPVGVALPAPAAHSTVALRLGSAARWRPRTR